jgi:hypothetical protein
MIKEYLFLMKSEITGAEFNLTQSISASWRSIGLKLGADKETVDSIYTNKNTDDERLAEVWTLWFEQLRKEMYPLSWEGLRKLLADIKQEAIAKDFFEYLGKI